MNHMTRTFNEVCSWIFPVNTWFDRVSWTEMDVTLNAMHLSQSMLNCFSVPSILVKMLSAVPEWVKHMSNNWLVTLPPFILNMRTVGGFIFSNPLSLDPSVAKAKGSAFMCSTKDDWKCLAYTPFKMQVVLVWAQQYALAISLSGKISLNKGVKWSDTAIGMLWWASTVLTLTSVLITFSWIGWLLGRKNWEIHCCFSRALAIPWCFFPSKRRLTSFSPWCSQLSRHWHIVQWNLYFVAGATQGHFFVQSGLDTLQCHPVS